MKCEEAVQIHMLRDLHVGALAADKNPKTHRFTKIMPQIKGERGKGEGPGEGGGSQGELGEGPGVVDLQRCWGFPEQSFVGRIKDLGSSQ